MLGTWAWTFRGGWKKWPCDSPVSQISVLSVPTISSSYLIILPLEHKLSFSSLFHLGWVKFPFLSSWSFLTKHVFLECVELLPFRPKNSGLLVLPFFSWLPFGCAALLVAAPSPLLEQLSLYILCTQKRSVGSAPTSRHSKARSCSTVCWT